MKRHFCTLNRGVEDDVFVFRLYSVARFCRVITSHFIHFGSFILSFFSGEVDFIQRITIEKDGDRIISHQTWEPQELTKGEHLTRAEVLPMIPMAD
ncbi:MAG: hypothetical protein ACJAXX_001510 [Roseivirga sp.]|jgi:hypothetical protein